MILAASCSAVDPRQLAKAAKVGTSARIGLDASRSTTGCWCAGVLRAHALAACPPGPAGPKDEPANATKLHGPERDSRAHRRSVSRLKFDVAELHHVRAGLHQPPAHYGEVLGCAKLEAKDQ